MSALDVGVRHLLQVGNCNGNMVKAAHAMEGLFEVSARGNKMCAPQERWSSSLQAQRGGERAEGGR